MAQAKKAKKAKKPAAKKPVPVINVDVHSPELREMVEQEVFKAVRKIAPDIENFENRLKALEK